MGEAEDRGRLFFEVKPWDSHLMVRISAKGPYMPRPKTLERLYELLCDKRDGTDPFSAFISEFPEEERVAGEISRVLDNKSWAVIGLMTWSSRDEAHTVCVEIK